MAPWKLINDEKPIYGMNVLIETTDGWMHEAFRNIGSRGDFYRSGRFTIDEKQIFAWRPLPSDYHGQRPVNSVNVDIRTDLVERLRPYLRHQMICDLKKSHVSAKQHHEAICTCGLGDLLKEIGGE